MSNFAVFPVSERLSNPGALDCPKVISPAARTGPRAARLPPGADGSLAGPAQNAVPFTRSPGDALSDERLVWSTKSPAALASGLRFMDTPSVLARALA